MASQRFCLRWNNHQSNLLSVFDQLLHAETFTDVTLAIDGQYLKAHKMVLSACSPYFQQLFINHPEKHPIVILRDVPYADMKSLLDFMYRGEVSVDQERLSAFLRVAESLRIKGLTEVNDEKPSSREQTETPLSTAQQNRMHNNSYAQQQRKVHQQQQQQQQISQQQQQQSTPQPQQTSSPIGTSMPKRKRGRPRKLSGSDDVDDYDDDYRENLLQGSPDLMEAKMNTDNYSNSGNDTNSEENDSRRRPDDTDEDSRSQQKRQNDGSTQETNSSKKDDSTNDGLLIPKTEPMETNDINVTEMTPQPQIRVSGFASQTNTSNNLSSATNNFQLKNDAIESDVGVDRNQMQNISRWIKHDNGSINTSPIIIANFKTLTSTNESPSSNSSILASPTSGQKTVRRRIRRKNQSPDDQALTLTEMSVRGLNLFRYASIQDGVYQCTECLKENVQKTFKNKYSFQRHAFLYHEGTQRKVFPCPVCRKEFSRPDKMKNHMKMTHECYMPKECKFPIPLITSPGSSTPQIAIAPTINNNNNNVATMPQHIVATSQ
ncbi:protein tramtrack, alpha isoform isoform X2 [Chironomus tepperi]|uniref:protein tramtrack, alpha isoform isoform X2 n=1 Tax=Chironomus tepperi TaxID=113505 RepID=UPI00391F036D